MSNDDEVTGRWLEELSEPECLALLRANAVGRIAVIHEGRPFIFPINFRLVEVGGAPLVVVRTRPGDVIDLADDAVAFEVDGIDPSHQRGWSVLVQGSLRHVAADVTLLEAHFDSESWIAEGRSTWLAIAADRISGRRLVAATLQWAFHQSAYL
jgi:nitroimidazol reductase NimA-like FMN-containing flavoprotein (pyridoxamine 5'-phosphate oxidase superfamily)